MPEEGVPLSPSHNLLSADEIVRLATIFAANGVTKIRLTGGEPTLRKDIVDIVGGWRLASIPGIRQVGMTTNGIALRQKLEALASAGLNKLNISLDTLNEAKYMIITRRNGFNKVMRSIELAESIFDQVKINNVVIRGINDEELTNFVSLTEF
uniref:Radical SAM core domain-containing protein n=1 Tax=Parascaris equorum TaxID=6256 RepID=A0A914RVA9_PAREQ